MKSKEDKIIAFFLAGIWAFLLLFALLTLIKPTWLEDISKPGMNVEAATKKRRADNFLEKKEYVKAIMLYKEVLKLAPDMKGAVSNLALAYYKTGELSKAIIVYEDLAKRNPDFPGIVYYNLAEIYNKTGKKDKALEYYLKAADTMAFPAKAYRKAGKLLMDKHRWKEASANFLLALKNNPTAENRYRGMLKKSLVIFKEEKTLTDTIKAQLENLDFRKIAHRYDSYMFDKETAYSFDIAKTYNYLGYCYGMLGQLDDAFDNLKKAVEMVPDYTDAINNLQAIKFLMEKKGIEK